MLILEELSDESLDAVLAFTPEQKIKYFSTLIETFYKDAGEEEIDTLLQHYISSFYLEKIYRSNVFLYKAYTPIYTSTGLIRNLVANNYYTDFETQVH